MYSKRLADSITPISRQFAHRSSGDGAQRHQKGGEGKGGYVAKKFGRNCQVLPLCAARIWEQVLLKLSKCPHNLRSPNFSTLVLWISASAIGRTVTGQGNRQSLLWLPLCKHASFGACLG